MYRRMKAWWWHTAVAIIVAGCTGTAAVRTADRREVERNTLADTLQQLIEQAYDFAQPDVVTRMTALYPDTGRVISASGGEIIGTADSVRAGIAAFWQNAGRNMRQPKWQWGVVYVERLSDDAAVLTATWSIPHIAPTNEPHVIRGAWTAVFRRIDGDWKIIQEHLSVPRGT